MENTYVGPFLIVKKLGTNRRQKVYHARQTEQNKDVALKFIKLPPTIKWSNALDKIQREVNELQKLQHPSLVKVYGAGVDEDRIFFATELIEGESLSAILARRGKLTPDLVVEYGRQIAEVLRYLHSNDLIHSKLTPEKILVTQDHKIKISDLRCEPFKTTTLGCTATSGIGPRGLYGSGTVHRRRDTEIRFLFVGRHPI